MEPPKRGHYKDGHFVLSREVVLFQRLLFSRMCSKGYCIGLCVCMCVCLLTNLTYGASVRPENAVTYSAGNEGQEICLKQLHSRVMQQNTSEKANMLSNNSGLPTVGFLHMTHREPPEGTQ